MGGVSQAMTRVGLFKDKGHYGRKTVLWGVRVVIAPLAFVCAMGEAIGENVISPAMIGLHVWAHPCLYRKREKLPAPELDDHWKPYPN